MAIAKNVIMQNWQAIKNEIQKNWSSISEHDLERSKGNMRSVSKLVEKNYDQKQNEIKNALSTIIEKYGQSRRPTYWRTKKDSSINRRDFRNPTRH
ncbi:MAG: hypothetical protein JNL11_06015 [Bdellovibrionaceae bacterium]|nr:hypothetical protein [Pseudobdellovibrionaceae bacterium]